MVLGEMSVSRLSRERAKVVDAVAAGKVEVEEIKLKQNWERRGAGWGVSC